jgi:Helix-turn-helix domain
VSNIKTTEQPQLGEILRRLRAERGLELGEAAAELGVPAKSLRALEWDRRDLLGENGGGELIERRYAAFLGLDLGKPAVAAPAPVAAEAAPSAPSRDVRLAEWLALLAALGPPFVIALPFVFDDVPLVTLGLVFLSSLLLVGAALPEGVVARARLSSAGFGRYREPLGLAALGILIPVALFTALRGLV